MVSKFGTQFVETEALMAKMEDDQQSLDEILGKMLPGEVAQFRVHLQSIIWTIDGVRIKSLNQIPQIKEFPLNSVQCNNCGGRGCNICQGKGWLTPRAHTQGRRCAYKRCREPLAPNHIAVYCQNQCAFDDA